MINFHGNLYYIIIYMTDECSVKFRIITFLQFWQFQSSKTILSWFLPLKPLRFQKIKGYFDSSLKHHRKQCILDILHFLLMIGIILALKV